MSRYVTEAIGTFFLVLTIGLTAVLGVGNLAPVAIGSVLMVMVYMGGHVSGAHYNPAVTLGFVAQRGIPTRDIVPYIVAQVTGAILAALVVMTTVDATFAPEPAPQAALLGVLVLEVVFTFALMLVILNVATHPATEGNSYYGLAIGFTVAVGAFAAGPVTGGVFNPAVGLGPILVQTFAGDGSMASLWIYLVAPVVGALAAVPVFRLQLPDER